MTNNIQEQKTRRLDIIDGITRGTTKKGIAARLGVPIRVVNRELYRMQYLKDPMLKKAYIHAREQALVKKQLVADKSGVRFHGMTGMTFKEKTFNNMMSFYRPELREILKAENEGDAIRALPASVRKTLRRNGITAQVWKSPRITADARAYMAGT